MSKKGVYPITKTPNWLQILINPRILEQHRELQIKSHALQKEKLRLITMKKGIHHDQEDNLFSLKQLSGHYQCAITKDNFPQGAETQWIQTLKSIDHKDPVHATQEILLREIQHLKADEKKVIEQAVLEDTKDQQVYAQKEIHKEMFPTYIVNSLENSPSKSLIIQLVNSKNETEPLALVQLGAHGVWLHDPKIGFSICFKNTDMTGFKEFLINHIQVNHQGFNKAFVIQVGNKDKLKSSYQTEQKDIKKDLLFHDKKLTNQTQLSTQAKNVQQDEKSDPKNKQPKPKH